MNIKTLSAVLFTLAIGSCATTAPPPSPEDISHATATISADDLVTRIKVLSSDDSKTRARPPPPNPSRSTISCASSRRSAFRPGIRTEPTCRRSRCRNSSRNPRRSCAPRRDARSRGSIRRTTSRSPSSASPSTSTISRSSSPPATSSPPRTTSATTTASTTAAASSSSSSTTPEPRYPRPPTKGQDAIHERNDNIHHPRGPQEHDRREKLRPPAHNNPRDPNPRVYLHEGDKNTGRRENPHTRLPTPSEEYPPRTPYMRRDTARRSSPPGPTTETRRARGRRRATKPVVPSNPLTPAIAPTCGAMDTPKMGSREAGAGPPTRAATVSYTPRTGHTSVVHRNPPRRQTNPVTPPSTDHPAWLPSRLSRGPIYRSLFRRAGRSIPSTPPGGEQGLLLAPYYRRIISIISTTPRPPPTTTTSSTSGAPRTTPSSASGAPRCTTSGGRSPPPRSAAPRLRHPGPKRALSHPPTTGPACGYSFRGHRWGRGMNTPAGQLRRRRTRPINPPARTTGRGRPAARLPIIGRGRAPPSPPPPPPPTSPPGGIPSLGASRRVISPEPNPFGAHQPGAATHESPALPYIDGHGRTVN